MVRSFGASEWDVARLVVVPNAMPYIIAGLRLAIGRAVLGVVVAEFFGSESGLGVMMVQAAGRYQVDVVFSGLIVFAALSLLMTAMVQMLENRLSRWRPQQPAVANKKARPDRPRFRIPVSQVSSPWRPAWSARSSSPSASRRATPRARNCSGSGSGLSLAHWPRRDQIEPAGFEDLAVKVRRQFGRKRVVQFVPEHAGLLVALRRRDGSFRLA